MANSPPLAPVTVEFPTRFVYRVARTSTLLNGSKIRERDSITQLGHRFDLVDSAVIYCARNLKVVFSIFLIDCVEPLPFLNIEDPGTLSFLDHELANVLEEIGVNSSLDISLIRGSNRRLTRAVSGWAANQLDEDGEFLYSEIRYKSRLGDWECWAIFEETEVKIVGTQEIGRTNPDLLAIANLYQLTIH